MNRDKPASFWINSRLAYLVQTLRGLRNHGTMYDLAIYAFRGAGVRNIRGSANSELPMIRQVLIAIALMLPIAAFAEDAASVAPVRVTGTAAARSDAERATAALNAAKAKYNSDLARAWARWIAAANLDALPEPKLSADPKASEAAKAAEIKRINLLLAYLRQQKIDKVLQTQPEWMVNDKDMMDAVEDAARIRGNNGK